ncbi:sigma-54-dependent transcriptional regulator [Haliovirga abyssi]|uniref:Acetoacetate metabolism regulatory protein AtoC n=1 Tax=Haliovirga abyssi TaxID=2996794 RepID=A0AAU9DMR9_9FUSO|nr:sigma-54 dependent transcriptional regulator [Haliovirga abyssi]BDU51327.1 acetoacetate metabolism regulatory protein AtoC [Haliovirga abyssi]
MWKILIVDDEEVQLDILKDILELEGYEVYTANRVKAGIDLSKKERVDLIISDYKMPDLTGEDFLDEINRLKLDISFILLTAYGTVETAVRCMKKGAYGFLTKPVNIEELKETIKKALETKKVKIENRNLKDIIKENSAKTNLIYQSKKMENVENIIKKVADLDVPVLIEGETGTGKEVVAKAVHNSGNRENEPFIAVNVATLPDNLVESELFGHKKGSFTGAINDKKGKFELAGEGTIFLDEIGEMNIELQAKLLRVLQEKEIEKVGGGNPIKINCRVIAATNRNLEDEIKKGNFREDLYYRLNLVKIILPPLRERDGDIELLIKYFIDKYSKKYKVTEEEARNYEGKLIEKYKKYQFPGNVRELENLVERFLIMPDMEIEIKKSENKKDVEDCYVGKTLNEIEKEAILKTLEHCNGNKTQAAKILGISSRGIRYKLKDWE